MSAWAQLVPVALVGTERHAGGVGSWPGEIGRLISSAMAEPTPRAAGVLRAAAVLAACEGAGTLGSAWPLPLPAPAAPDARPVVRDAALLNHIEWTLRDGPPHLLHDVGRALERTGWLLAPRLLPAALDAGRRSMALRTALMPVLGARGVWLAAQHEEWRWAAGAGATRSDDEALWTDGTLEQRRDFLRRERVRDATRARERLGAVLSELPARERAELVAQLEPGLTLADEALLDQLRADRSKEVRHAVWALLLRLPDAAHVQQAGARLAPLLTQERVLLRKRWGIDAPAVAPNNAEPADPIRPKEDALGERARWLYQMARQVPLAWWCGHTGMTPAELRDWAHDTDWTDALLRAWRDVLHAAPDAAWGNAFLDQWPKAWPREERGAVLAALPPAQREPHWQRELKEGEALQPLAAQWLAACAGGETLSRGFSAEVATRLRAQVEDGVLARNWPLRQAAAEIACVLHIDALPALKHLPPGGETSAGLTEALQTIGQIVETRLALSNLPQATTPP